MTILDNYKKFSFTVIVIRIQPLGFRLVEVTKDCDAANSGKLLHRGQFPWRHWRVPKNHQGNPFPLTTGKTWHATHENCWGNDFEMITIQMTGKQDKMFKSSPLKKSVSFFHGNGLKVKAT